MDYPQNEADLKACLQSYANSNYVGMLDPRTDVTISNTIEISQPTAYGTPWGVNGNYAKLRYRGAAGNDLLRFKGTDGQNCRCLNIEKLVLDGGGPDSNGMGASACLKLWAPNGDNGPLYKFLLRDIYASSALYGIELEGGVYEGMLDNVHCENHAKDGIYTHHYTGGTAPGWISNIFIVHPNSSRNFGAGIRCTYSTYIIGGSYILNGDGGVQAPEGLRGMIMSNGENTAGKDQSMVVVPSNGYGSVIDLCEASSDGSTHCRRWDGANWVDVGSPMLYGLAAPGEVASTDCHTSYYGQGGNPMRWRK